jgi:hypothetical protein
MNLVLFFKKTGCDRGPYIALGVERKSLDQTDFDVGWRYILEGGRGIL